MFDVRPLDPPRSPDPYPLRHPAMDDPDPDRNHDSDSDHDRANLQILWWCAWLVGWAGLGAASYAGDTPAAVGFVEVLVGLILVAMSDRGGDDRGGGD